MTLFQKTNQFFPHHFCNHCKHLIRRECDVKILWGGGLRSKNNIVLQDNANKFFDFNSPNYFLGHPKLASVQQAQTNITIWVRIWVQAKPVWSVSHHWRLIEIFTMECNVRGEHTVVIRRPLRTSDYSTEKVNSLFIYRLSRMLIRESLFLKIFHSFIIFLLTPLSGSTKQSLAFPASLPL